MEAKDLMIGDWVNIAVEGYNNPTRIRGIGSFWVKVIKDEMAYGNILVTPIILTTEILEKNGFYYDEDRNAYLMGVIFQVKPERHGLFSFKICGCPYPLSAVHELQHALKLCGIDKEIEL